LCCTYIRVKKGTSVFVALHIIDNESFAIALAFTVQGGLSDEFITANIPRDRCYDYLNIFAEKFSEKIGVFDSKQS
jgi:hypothetical protein